MGFFSNLFGGGKSNITINVPKPPKLPTAEELFSAGRTEAQTTAPIAFGARETALQDIATPQATQEYFGAFQPTSLEEALGSQYFENIMPDLERSIKHSLSLSGIESSPILSQQIARARGDVGATVGEFLANQANQRALTSLQGRNIDPMGMIMPFVGTGMQQSTAQANLQSQYDQQVMQADLYRQIQEAQSRASGISSIGSLLGGGAGFLMGGPGGAALGASLGGSAASLFGGGETPFSLQDALSVYGQFGGGTPATGQQPGTLTRRLGQGAFDTDEVLPVYDFASTIGGF